MPELHTKWMSEELEAAMVEGLDSGDPIAVTPEFWEGIKRWVLRAEGGADSTGKGGQAALGRCGRSI